MDKHDKAKRLHSGRCSVIRAAAALVVAALFAVGAVPSAEAQYDSGSSGIHGVFPPVPEGGSIPSNWSVLVWNVRTGGIRYCNSYTLGTGSDQCNAGASVNVFAQIPNIPAGGLTTGIYEFTDVAIPSLTGTHRAVVLVGHSPNVPVSILSQADINLSGNASGWQLNIHANGWNAVNTSSNFSTTGGRAGPGGFHGAASGNGGVTPGDGSGGFGPAGGPGGRADATMIDGFHGVAAAASPLNPSLTPLTGGSGGGGAAGVGPDHPLGCGGSILGYGGGAGGGGGGALLLAASGRIALGPFTFINADGGNGARNTSTGCELYGGGGSGGNVRIVAQEFVGNGTINVSGGTRQNGTNRAAGGHVRIEASLNTFSGSISGAAGGSFLSFPTASIPANQPVLRITSIAGATAPQSPSASLGTPDITFADAIETPVTLQIGASNVPLGTAVNIRVVPATGQPTTATTTGLSGTLADSTAQATVILPPGAGVVTATATFNIPTSEGTGGGIARNSLPLIDGERPELVEVIALADGTSRTYLISTSGTRFEVGTAVR